MPESTPAYSNDPHLPAIRAQAQLHHAYFLGLLLRVSTQQGAQVVGDWIFRLFRRQHEEKFLSSFTKLGLTGLPHAVACARYHVLSNNIGGVGVEYAYENDRKAWVRFRYPRWMFDGPTICGVPVEASRGFLRGWYAHNGVSLNNPRLGFVCVSEDMTGEYGLCGYFKEYDHDLSEAERLVFAKDEAPPPYSAAAQPQPPANQWDDTRLDKANRNYAVDYVRNGLCELARVIGVDATQDLGRQAARLIGLQYYRTTAALLDSEDGDLDSACGYLQQMLQGMGDEVSVEARTLQQAQLRIVRGLDAAEQTLVLACWSQLFAGALAAQRQRKTLTTERVGAGMRWQVEVA